MAAWAAALTAGTAAVPAAQADASTGHGPHAGAPHPASPLQSANPLQFAHPLQFGHARRGANRTSTNWAGYAATGGSFTTVGASWVEPDVTCTSTGIVAFWVGLDGWGSDTVEQDGTGVDCTHGTPRHFAWWETYPVNSIQQYSDPVAVGDHLSSTVTAQAGGVYELVLTDATQGWTERNLAHLAGAADASAEIVAEAVTAGDNVTPLPDFHSAAFTGATVDGVAAPAAGAVPVDMTDQFGARIAQTQRADTAGDFQVDYTGSTLGQTVSRTPRTTKTSSRPSAARR